MMCKQVTARRALVASMLAITLGMTACSSSDDDDDAGTTTGATGEGGTDNGSTLSGGGNAAVLPIDGDDPDASGSGESTFNPNLMVFDFALDSSSTVPPANVNGASGTGTISVDTSTGVIAGSVTVVGTSGTPNAAHIHEAAAGSAGGVVLGLDGNADGTVWSVPEGSTLDAAGIAAFNAGNLYINVHTPDNPSGELRGQLVNGSLPSSGSYTITFRNTSDNQPMTPPVVALHNAPGADNGIRLFEVGQPAIGEVIQLAETGATQPLADVAIGQIATGRVSDAGIADGESGPLLPGGRASITLMPEMPDQVLSVLSMVVCTNDAFTGVDSRPLPADNETFLAPIYDAGSETNVLTLDQWVGACSPDGSSANLGDEENGSIMAHPGQAESENTDYDFAAGSEFLEISVTRNP